jgi:hypothetical protein
MLVRSRVTERHGYASLLHQIYIRLASCPCNNQIPILSTYLANYYTSLSYIVLDHQFSLLITGM